MSDPTAGGNPADNGGADGAAPGGAPAPWYGQVDESTAAYLTNKGWDTPAKAIESYRNLEKFAGGSKSLVELPGMDADDAAYGAFYDRLGRPKDAAGYGIEPPQGSDKELADWFTKTAHSHGLTPRQAKGLFNEWQTMSGARMAALEDSARIESEGAISALRKEWGGQYDAHITAGRRAAASLGYNEQALSTLEARMGTAEMLKLFATLGSKMGEPSFADGGRSGEAGGFGTSKAGAAQQLADLKTDKQFMEAYLKGDKDAVAKMTRLMGLAHGPE